MYVRFITKNRIDKCPESGLFVAVRDLLDNGTLQIYERENLEDLIAWFNKNLPVPSLGRWYSRPIYWYRNAPECISKMWEIATILKAHDYDIEVVKANYAGRIVYSDTCQIAAIPKVSRF